MFVVKKRIQGKEYYYLKVSGRVQGKPKSKTVAYLGKAPLTETQLKKKIQHIPKMKINSALKDLQQESIEFHSEDKKKEMTRIGKDFLKKLKTLDPKLLEDMFSIGQKLLMYLPRILLPAEYELLHLVEMVDPENPFGILSVAACLFSETGRDACIF